MIRPMGKGFSVTPATWHINKAQSHHAKGSWSDRPDGPENKKIAAVWIAAETLLNLRSQSLHAAAHIRVTGRDPNASAG
jgi:hypothetical protein